jgi:inhibitor of KinA
MYLYFFEFLLFHIAKEGIFMKISPLGDQAIIIELDKKIHPHIHQQIKSYEKAVEQNPFPGFIEMVLSYTTVTIFYDPLILSYQAICEKMIQLYNKVEESDVPSSRVIDIPVCYGGDYGPDLEFVAQHNNLTSEDVIRIHSEREYLVYMIGFAPGFPYLGGMSERIAAPRQANPRLEVPAGSVGVAGKQTGIYSLATPGGWQIIGRTPYSLFRSQEVPPSLLQAGDHVQFVPISAEEYQHLKRRNCYDSGH